MMHRIVPSLLCTIFAYHQTHAFVNSKGTAQRSRPSSTLDKQERSSTPSSLLAEKRPSNNPFQSLLGGMASSIASSIPGGGNGMDSAALDAKLKDVVASSWNDIQDKLESKQTPEERAFRDNVAKGIGPPSPLNKIRLFDESNKEEDIRVTLYRDHASWCPYCHKVWCTLEEKRIPYRVEKVNMRCYGEKPSSFLRLQPNGNIPVAVIDGTIYNQSNDIMFALEQFFPDHKPMLPPQTDQNQRMRAQELLNLERTIFSGWMQWLTGSDRSKARFINVLERVESELKKSKGGDFFLGKDVSLVDMMFVPFLERMCASLLFFKGFQIRVPTGTSTDYPAINKWFDAMETLTSYQLTKSDYYTHNWDLPPQLGGCTYEKTGAPFEAAINGDKSLDGTRGSWELPLQDHLGGVEPDWHWCGDEQAALREATERLCFNHAGIVPFAARGAGKAGFPSYSAALSDPNAVPNESVKGSVDACLRVVSMAMLDGTESAKDTMDKLAQTINSEGGKGHTDNVIASLAYLRDRVGVPRDMRLPAARQLRAHLNWAIAAML